MNWGFGEEGENLICCKTIFCSIFLNDSHNIYDSRKLFLRFYASNTAIKTSEILHSNKKKMFIVQIRIIEWFFTMWPRYGFARVLYPKTVIRLVEKYAVYLSQGLTKQMFAAIILEIPPQSLSTAH